MKVRLVECVGQHSGALRHQLTIHSLENSTQDLRAFHQRIRHLSSLSE